MADGPGRAAAAGQVGAVAGLLGISGLAEAIARLRGADPPGTMAVALEGQAALVAQAVQEGLGDQPGGGHDRPWLETGALRASIGHQANGLQAAVGSSDPAAAPQEMGTMHLPPRPFLAPAAAAMGKDVAKAAAAAVAGRLGRAGTDGHGLSDEPPAEVVNFGFGDAAFGFGGLMLGLGLLAL